jgi:flavin reductase (DIM6/NTAB) family NADH-FMN oxidoreductase RutF
VLEGAAAVIECRVVHLLDTGGDHDLLVGEVVNALILKEGNADTTLTLPDLKWNYAG